MNLIHCSPCGEFVEVEIFFCEILSGHVTCQLTSDVRKFDIMHQSFASPAPPGPGNSGAFNFSIFKARHCQARILVKPLLKAPAPQGLTITWNNSWELF